MNRLYIDIGGTHLRSEFHSKDMVQKDDILTKDIELTEFIDNFIKSGKKPNLISISFAGQVKDGHIISSPNIEIKNRDIKDYYGKKGIEVRVENDLKCAILAEHNHFKEKNIALLFIGSGIGSSVMAEDKIVRGEDNIACEVGHIPFKNAPFSCGCGKFNCIEIFSSGVGLKKWFDYYNIDFKELGELKSSDKKEEIEIYQNFIEGILRAAATILTLFNPKLLVLGGGIAKSNPYILDIIKRDLKKFAFSKSLEKVEIVLSRLENASLEGAKLL